MDGVLQKVVSTLIAIVILFILPVYIAYEKKDDISYALALKITTDFVDNVNNKGYLTQEMYNDFISKLSVTQNSYDIYMEHTAKKYNPVIYSYTDDLTTIRAKFDYNLHKAEYDAGQITTSDGVYNNLILAYDLSEKKYTEQQILDVISSTDRTLTTATTLDVYKNLDFRTLPATSNIYMPKSNTKVYTMSEGDEFNVIIKNKNSTLATIMYNAITFGIASQNNTRIYVNYGGTIKAETYRDRSVLDDNVNYNKPDENPASSSSSLVNSYITNGLVALFNGEYNNGTSHSNMVDVWKDLSGNNNNAMLSGFDFNDESGWIYNGLQLTGKEYVSIDGIDSDEYTIEVVAKFDTVQDTENSEQSVLSNLNMGGLGLVFNQLNSTNVAKRGKMSFDVYTDNEENPISSVMIDNVIQANRVYSMSGSVGKIGLDKDANGLMYETNTQLICINNKANGIPFTGAYQKPASGSSFIIGGNPLAGAGAQTQFKGTIYCIRVYDRALTEEEIKENYKIDKERYGLTDLE